MAHAGARIFSAPNSWLSQLPGAAPLAAGCELFYRLGKDYEKPTFDIPSVEVRGTKVSVVERTVLLRPFCRLIQFERHSDQTDVLAAMKRDPVVLLVAPLSGHHATLLRDTVRTLLGGHRVFVTDWVDARMVPREEGAFGLGDYVGYVRDFLHHIGADRVHVVAVCQAAVPVLASVALMAAAGETEPRSLTLMAGPLDPRRSPTAVNRLATTHTLDWFKNHLLHQVPARYPGHGRWVYPGFLQHASFIAMNPLRHVNSHWDFYQSVARGDMGDAESHRRFYDEYNAVLDMSGDYYLDCVRIVFQEHLLPRGLWQVGGMPVTTQAISRAALFTIEGSLDDISGLGQTQVAHELTPAIPDARKRHLTVQGAGHYGVFTGRRWRESVYPLVRDFIAATDQAPRPRRRTRKG
jgi:poly(3-hydroxybutyrate) depolymerase